MSDHDRETLLIRSLMGLVLTRTLIPFEFSGSNWVLSLLAQKIKVLFIFLY